ncbi:putative glycolipid-binding domain-containing protein [Agromyces seonyuensis]|uniref:Glycolipid-binding domain-containing protein n=1 Tax=Agromyces seonyuensis TaxID=2662446 RepID=A0A6I4P818_9MICO|nr:putative glycolipid-binding domain-containing protein [Agromyces seonyuensis]MWB99997.1 hypothetical protein [Agromyces seonyuensis]
MEFDWIGDDGTAERCVVALSPRGGMRVESRVVGPFGTCGYRASTDEEWRFTELTLELGGRRLDVRRRDAGWTVDGTPRPDLAPAVDLDLSISPVTNTLPIRRLALRIGDSADLTTGYVAVPELTVAPDPQRYTRTGAREYRYESLDSEFARTITVDEAGFVVEYPGLFHRGG